MHFCRPLSSLQLSAYAGMPPWQTCIIPVTRPCCGYQFRIPAGTDVKHNTRKKIRRKQVSVGNPENISLRGFSVFSASTFVVSFKNVIVFCGCNLDAPETKPNWVKHQCNCQTTKRRKRWIYKQLLRNIGFASLVNTLQRFIHINLETLQTNTELISAEIRNDTVYLYRGEDGLVIMSLWLSNGMRLNLLFIFLCQAWGSISRFFFQCKTGAHGWTHLYDRHKIKSAVFYVN